MTHASLRRSIVPAAALTLALAALLGPAAAGAAAATAASPAGQAAVRPTASDRDVVAGLERYAHPLRTAEPGGPAGDLAAFASMTRGASIVGFGEASHGSKEVFTVKDRLFRQLVRREGFSAYAMEISWSAATRLNTYLLTGKGDVRQIMREEFQDGYSLLNTEELAQLFDWMREYNRTGSHKIRVVGMDFSDADPEQYERILTWAEGNEPALAPELRRHYAALRALPTGVAARMAAYNALPLAERKAIAKDAEAAYQLLSKAGKQDPWVLQEARILSHMATEYTVDWSDPAQAKAASRHRDRTMAETAVWWQRQTGERIVVSAHNGHVSYESAVPEYYPVTMGADLRELAGRDYLAVGTSFYGGDYRAKTATGESGTYSVGPAAPGSNEYTLDQVRHRDFYVDLRAAGRNPAVKSWLNTERPTFVVPGRYPNDPTPPLALGRAFDIVVHLHHVQASVAVPPQPK
ncbi:erythromycin esterase family protein [Streptomyces telluris]|uniref:Erythromycin esterase family protein n=1 Tax=Streptomyces telluris TaxID=2720021 RepID=A0A9X2RN57_9ACTN|nr:erythromycin esterase family protein [Streptomyces telluris]MCQ8771614.1 erythromycin esterase family protein [Streptomyces telluris]NJP81327.1 erythromycin esterase family protein [Streptomyces telluris]